LNYDSLSGYKWVPDFHSSTKLERDLKDLRREKDRVSTLLLVKKDYWKRIVAAHEHVESRRYQGLVAILNEYRQSHDPLQFFQQRLRDPFSHWLDSIPSLDEFKKVFDALPEGEISEADREKQLAALDKKITGLDSKLQKLRSNEKVKLAKRFVQDWRQIQRQISSACSPFGISLDQCSRRERSAWKDLGIDKYLSDTAPYLVHPGPPKTSYRPAETKKSDRKAMTGILHPGVSLTPAIKDKGVRTYQKSDVAIQG